MAKLVKILRVFFVLFVFTGCESKQAQKQAGSILLHRANETLLTDSTAALIAVKQGLKVADGVELDGQMSLDGTLWIHHDQVVKPCGYDNPPICLPRMTDEKLKGMKNCRSGKHLVKLNEVMELISRTDRYLSLDIKGYFKKDCFDGEYPLNPYLEKLAGKIVELVARYEMEQRTLVETDYSVALDIIREKNPNIQCYLLGYTDMRKVAKNA